MLSRFRQGSQRFVLVVCSVLLAMLLAACSFGGASSPTPTPTPTPPPSPTPSPTASSGLTSYSGQGYTIGYPVGWKVNAQATKVTFVDATGVYSLTIATAPNPGGTISADTIATTGVSLAEAGLKNSQTVNVPSTTTVGGESWVQKSVSGTATQNGQSVDLQAVVIADNHPANSPMTNSFTIVYLTAAQLFTTANATYFQPMLQSFKFTS